MSRTFRSSIWRSIFPFSGERFYMGEVQMTDIVAGRFEQQDDAQAAVERLLQHGFRRDDVSSFFVNPPGQHAKFPVGGDRNVSPGARGAGLAALGGALLGGVLGFIFGMAASHVFGLVATITGIVAGAYLGMLAGALARLQDRAAARQRDVPPVRHAGMMVAAHTPTPSSHDEAVRALKSSGAVEVEEAEGEWHDGGWADFDPTVPPSHTPSFEGGPDRSRQRG
jgi:outer membrane lipoprotein SlyB